MKTTKQQQLSGLFSALIVPFDEMGQVNEAGLRQVIRYNIDKMQVDGLYVGGSTGENFLLDSQTKEQILRVVKKEVGDNTKLIAQIGGMNLYECIELGNIATELGYDAISAVTPFYYPFTFEEIKQYYFNIVDAVDNDLIIYAIPQLTGVSIGLSQFKQLFAHPKICGVKFTANDFYLLGRLRLAFPSHLIYAGLDEMLLPALSYGVDGAIGSTYNVSGHLARQIISLAKAGNYVEARGIQHQTSDLITAVLENGLYSTLKSLLVLSGCDAKPFLMRKPFTDANATQLAKAKEIYARFLM